MKSIAQRFEAGLKPVALLASLLMLLIMGLISWEVISRYLLNSPTSYVWPISRQLFGVYVLIAGSWTLVRGGHIRIEILYERFSPRGKSIISALSGLALVVIAGVIVWQGTRMGMEAWQTKEVATGVFKMPLWPLKLLIPAGGLLLLVSGVLHYIVRLEKSE